MKSRQENFTEPHHWRRTVLFLTGIYPVALLTLTCYARSAAALLREHHLFVPVLVILFLIPLAWAVRIVWLYFPGSRVQLLLRGVFCGGILGAILSYIPIAEEQFHFLEFGLFALLVRRAAAYYLPPMRQYLLAIIATAFLGLADEILQYYLPARFLDPRDIAMNTLAGILTILSYEFLFRKLKAD